MSSSTFLGFNDHHKLKDTHALLSASKFHWLNYDDERLTKFFVTSQACELGTKLHDFAATCIELGQKLPHSKKTLNLYVNDAIGFGMKPEQVLYYSDNCFGTADAICFRDGLLRIHDLKTGDVKAHIEQLYIYAALFCLEYHINPYDIKFELRIYQHDEVLYEHPESSMITTICDKIRHCDQLINRMKEETNAD